MKNKKYHVGKFSLSDHMAVINISGSVEVARNYIDTLFFISLNPNSGAEGISIKLSSIEMRALVFGIESVTSSPLNSGVIHSKESGGKGIRSTLKISSNEKYHYIGLTKENINPVQISFKPFELLGLSREIINLVNETVLSTYKTQQVRERKRMKIKRELELQKNKEK